MTFRTRACDHLSVYMRDCLGIKEMGVFFYRGQKLQKTHILPRGSECRNLLEPYGSSFFLSEHNTAKRHRFFHHLNSSQALCFNLFFPLLTEGALDLLAQSLGSTIHPPFKSTFEAESELEVAERRTSFDFHIQNAEGHEVFVEVKYTEDGFGTAKNDEEHQNKFRDTYAPLLKNNEYLTGECKDQDFFLKNYQILRNLIHIRSQSEVTFLFPRANMKVAKQAEHARSHFLSEKGRNKFHIIYLEDLVPQLVDACKGGKLDGYYESFEKKYIAFLR